MNHENFEVVFREDEYKWWIVGLPSRKVVLELDYDQMCELESQISSALIDFSISQEEK